MEIERTEFSQDISDEAQPDSAHTDDTLDDTDETHEYRRKLRSHTQRLGQENSDKTVLICNITELFLQNEFEDYVNQLIQDLEIDLNSFYR